MTHCLLPVSRQSRRFHCLGHMPLELGEIFPSSEVWYSCFGKDPLFIMANGLGSHAVCYCAGSLNLVPCQAGGAELRMTGAVWAVCTDTPGRNGVRLCHQ